MSDDRERERELLLLLAERDVMRDKEAARLSVRLVTHTPTHTQTQNVAHFLCNLCYSKPLALIFPLSEFYCTAYFASDCPVYKSLKLGQKVNGSWKKQFLCLRSVA